MTESTKTVEIVVNGKPLQARVDLPLLQTLLDEGVYVPHYCYHPALTPAGNCRMCLVKTAKVPKPIIACATYPTEGMEITTESEEIKELREFILEFLLINHPLDCPVCDQAGECELQEYSFRYGKDDSRFVEEKTYKHTKPLGPQVNIYGNRCIVCTRCVRFCDEITGTGELCVTGRGDNNIIDTFPGIPLDNPISACTVDLCPVGALLASDFVHKTRVFFLKSTPSTCNMCATGCSINVDTWNGEIQRLRPRHNPDVNDWWMCDRGRAGYHYISSEQRLRSYQVAPPAAAPSSRSSRQSSSFEETLLAIASRAGAVREEHGAGAFAFIASPWMTLEEMWLFRQVAELLSGASPGSKLGPALGMVTAPAGSPWSPIKQPSAFRIEADRNPNNRGAETLLPEFVKATQAALMKRLGSTVRFAWVVGAGPDLQPPDKLTGALAACDQVVVQDLVSGPLSNTATILAPAAAFSEKDGTLINSRNWLQRLRTAHDAPASLRPEIDVYQELLRAAGRRERILSADGVLRELTATDGHEAMRGFSPQVIGTLGRSLADTAGLAAESATADGGVRAV